MVTGGITDKPPKIWGSFAQNFVYDHFQQPQWDAKQRVPKPDMHSMERLELYLWCYGIF